MRQLERMIITKLEAAHRQLTTAIRLYFDDDDLAAIHTLACAAREIYEKHCHAKGRIGCLTTSRRPTLIAVPMGMHAER